MKKSECVQLVMMLTAVFPHSKPSESTVAMYEELLSDLDFAKAKLVVAELARTHDFLPTVAAIRRAYADLTMGPVRSGASAYAEALAQVREVGWVGIPKWSDPIIPEALRLFGSWQDFCAAPDDAPSRARFIEHYSELAADARRRSVATPNQLGEAEKKKLK